MDTRPVEDVHHILEEAGIAERLAGDIDGETTTRRQRQPASGQGRQGILYHPAVQQGHQAITLRGVHEFAGEGQLPAFLGEPQEHFQRWTISSFRTGGEDRLHMQFETTIAQRVLQALQPMNLAALTSRGFIACRVDMDGPGTRTLGYIASRIRGAHDIFERAAFATHFYQTRGNTDLENAVLPDEAMLHDGAREVAGNLRGLLKRAAHQQQGEFVTADAGHRVAVAHGFA